MTYQPLTGGKLKSSRTGNPPKGDHKTRPGLATIDQTDISAILSNNGPNHGQAHSSALRLGGKTRFKNSFTLILGDARAGIADLDLD